MQVVFSYFSTRDNKAKDEIWSRKHKRALFLSFTPSTSSRVLFTRFSYGDTKRSRYFFHLQKLQLHWFQLSDPFHACDVKEIALNLMRLKICISEMKLNRIDFLIRHESQFYKLWINENYLKIVKFLPLIFCESQFSKRRLTPGW